VAFYLMLALRTLLRDKGWFESAASPRRTWPNCSIWWRWDRGGRRAAGCQQPHSDLAGLKPHSRRQVPSGIKALLEIANRDPQKLAASDLGLPSGRA
jgi:single-stranded-DNA-specific exonuclease